jgi:hypothetical protein
MDATNGWTSNSSTQAYNVGNDEYFYIHVHLKGVTANMLDENGNTVCVVDRSPSDSGTRPFSDDHDYTVEFSIGDTGAKNTDGVFKDLEAGEYTVVVWVDGDKYDEFTLTVEPGDVAKHTFDVEIIVNAGDPKKIVAFCPRSCGIWK